MVKSYTMSDLKLTVRRISLKCDHLRLVLVRSRFFFLDNVNYLASGRVYTQRNCDEDKQYKMHLLDL